MKTWIKDDNGNRCSVERFGSEETAKAALASLKDCSDCSDCSHCSDCSDCSYCSDCSHCSGCSDCSGQLGSTSKAAPIVPIITEIHAAVYAAASAPEALKMEQWHTCGTTHCRAGWVVTLAGEAGAELERFYNTELAAMMIYDASDPSFKINPSRFYGSNSDALADMKALAERATHTDTTDAGEREA